MKQKRVLVVAAQFVLSVFTVGAATHDVRAYGARGDGVARDTAAIQRAVDAAFSAGGGTVRVSAGRYLTGSVFLKSNVTLELEAGAELFGSPDPADYNRRDVCPQNWFSEFENASGGHLLLAIEQTNVVVRGGGTINGNSSAFLLDPKTGDVWPGVHRGIPWRTSQMVYFVECENVRVEDLRLVNSPYWSCLLHGCRKAWLRGLDVRTVRKPRTWNGDGIDIDCCQDVVISDCVIDTDDDCITLRGDPAKLRRRQDCARIAVQNCILSSDCNAVRIGVGDGKVRDAVFSNLVIRDTRTAVHVVSGYNKGRGTDIANIRFSNLQVDCGMFCCLRHGFSTEAEIGAISFSGVSGTARGTSIVWSNSKRPVGPVVFDNVDLGGPGVQVIGTDKVAFRSSSFAAVAVPDEERAKLAAEIDAGKWLGR